VNTAAGFNTNATGGSSHNSGRQRQRHGQQQQCSRPRRGRPASQP
jgi:hypothetical protein